MKILTDKQLHTEGDYIAYPGHFETIYSDVKEGEDYEVRIIVGPGFPNGTACFWRAGTNAPHTVHGFYQVGYGNPMVDNGRKVPSVRVGDMDPLYVTARHRRYGTPNANVIYNAFLTDVPRPVPEKEKHHRKLELLPYLHASKDAHETFARGVPMGEAGGWKIAVIDKAIPAVAMIGGGDTVPVTDVLALLEQKGVSSADWFYNGDMVGVEPTRGGGEGSWFLDSWTHSGEPPEDEQRLEKAKTELRNATNDLRRAQYALDRVDA